MNEKAVTKLVNDNPGIKPLKILGSVLNKETPK